MVTLILLLLICLIFGVFAAQNTQLVTVTFFNFVWKDVPQYLLMVLPLILGLAIAWIISLFGSFSHMLTVRKKDNTINQTQKSATELSKRVNELELENADLKEQLRIQNEPQEATVK